MGKTKLNTVYLGVCCKVLSTKNGMPADSATNAQNLGRPFDYGHRVDDRLASVTAFGFTCNFGYGG